MPWGYHSEKGTASLRDLWFVPYKSLTATRHVLTGTGTNAGAFTQGLCTSRYFCSCWLSLP